MNHSLCQKNDENKVEKYLPLVHKIVRQMNIKETSTVDRDDLESIGVIGLMDALNKYDSTKKTSFETYARTRIRGAIMDELRRLGLVSRDKMSAVKQYYKHKEELTQKLLREPTDVELCDYMKISSIELSKIFMTLHYLSVSSLETVVYSDEGGNVCLMDVIEDKNEENVLIKLEK
ncbi:MAG: sigma-70 family RNA polymerase sigma factor, partial [Turicibacter sp.]